MNCTGAGVSPSRSHAKPSAKSTSLSPTNDATREPMSGTAITPVAGLKFLLDAGVIYGNEGGTRNAAVTHCACAGPTRMSIGAASVTR